MGNKQLSNLHVRSGAHPARDRDRVDSKSPQADWLPDGVGRHSIPRAKLGARNRGLRGQLAGRGPLGRRLTLMLAWSIWLLIVAWRMKEPDQPGKRPTWAGPPIHTSALFIEPRRIEILRTWVNRSGLPYLRAKHSGYVVPCKLVTVLG